MGASHELDALIRDARRWEDPTLEERASVRRAIALRIAGGLGAPAATGDAIGAAARRTASSAGAIGGVLPALVLVVLCGLSADASLPEVEEGHIAVAHAPVPPPAESAPAPLGDVSSRAPEPVTQQPPSASSPSAPNARRRAQSAPAQSAAVQSARPSLAAESRALAAVQRALRDSEPERALGMLDEQDRTFARGVLAEERSAARVMALCDAQRADDAERAKVAFSVRHPKSPLLVRVRESCARSGVR